MGRILGPARYMTVRFEDLVLDTQASLERICSFLGLPYDARMLRYGEMVEEKIPGNRRWLWPAIARPPQQSKVGQWRQRLTRSQRLVFEGIARPPLRPWGAETHDRGPKPAAASLLERWDHPDQGT